MAIYIDSTGYNEFRLCGNNWVYCDGMYTKCKKFDFEYVTTTTPNKEEREVDVIS